MILKSSVMPENSWLIPNFTVRQIIMYFSIMKANVSDTRYIDKLVKILGVEKFQYQKISSLSQGYDTESVYSLHFSRTSKTNSPQRLLK